MKFDDSYFEGEVRDGFYVSPMMKRAWAAQLEVLERIDDICARNNIEYFAHAGTLLGAVRHGGFIPWDDDIDIEMKRLDFERFIKIAQRELPQEYKIHSSLTEAEWQGCFARVINTLDIPLKGERLREFHGFPFCAGVDIFPVDYLPLNKEEEKALLTLYTAVYTLAYDWDKEDMTEEEKMQNLEVIGECCNYTFTQNQPYRQQLWTLAGRIGAMYWDTGAEATELAPMYALANSSGFRLSADWYKNSKRIPFENTMIPVQGGYDKILSLHFGSDYMTPKILPSHEYPFYKKQLKLWIDDMAKKANTDQSEEKNSESKSEKYITDEKTGSLLPAKWANRIYENGKRKKILLYHTSADSLICQQNRIEDKLRYVFELARENEEILLWWFPGDFVKLDASFIDGMVEGLRAVYDKIKKEFINNNLGIYDDSLDVDRAINMADAYFGDDGKVMELFQKSGKPIMLQDYSVLD